jgi:hypothetical protein
MRFFFNFVLQWNKSYNELGHNEHLYLAENIYSPKDVDSQEFKFKYSDTSANEDNSFRNHIR